MCSRCASNRRNKGSWTIEQSSCQKTLLRRDRALRSSFTAREEPVKYSTFNKCYSLLPAAESAYTVQTAKRCKVQNKVHSSLLAAFTIQESPRGTSVGTSLGTYTRTDTQTYRRFTSGEHGAPTRLRIDKQKDWKAPVVQWAVHDAT